MKILLPGHEIAHIRKSFGMNADAFAQVLAVHPGTVRRWESAGAAAVPVDGVAASVLAVARIRLHSKPALPAAVVQAKGNEVEAALVAAGALVALALLIAFLTEKK
jgi:hypothetical protein